MGDLMEISSKSSIIVLYYTIPIPKPQTIIGNDYIYSLLASTATAAATTADSEA